MRCARLVPGENGGVGWSFCGSVPRCFECPEGGGGVVRELWGRKSDVQVVQLYPLRTTGQLLQPDTRRSPHRGPVLCWVTWEACQSQHVCCRPCVSGLAYRGMNVILLSLYCLVKHQVQHRHSLCIFNVHQIGVLHIIMPPT